MQQYAVIYLLLNYSTCFGRPSRPLSGVHKTVVAASGTDYTIWGASFLKRDHIRTVWDRHLPESSGNLKNDAMSIGKYCRFAGVGLFCTDGLAVKDVMKYLGLVSATSWTTRRCVPE